MYLIKEASKIAGVTIRTLHHYDQIGLIKVNKSENGYRYYTGEDIEKIKIIRYYRFLGLSLEKIGEIINGQDFDVITILESQLAMLKEEQKKVSLLMTNIRRTINSKKLEMAMYDSTHFEGFTILDNIKYQSKALNKFGKETMIENSKRQEGRELEINEYFNSIFINFAKSKNQEKQPEDSETQQLCQELYNTLNKYSFNCSLEVFEIIGKAYYSNLEFRRNIDQFGEGLAEYISKSIVVFVRTKISRYSDL